MLVHHKNLTLERWSRFSLMEQLGNIGSDVLRAIRGKNRGDVAYANAAFERSLELFYLTVEDPKNRNRRLKEICRAREAWIDYFAYDNIYGTDEAFWQRYFDDFAYAAAIQKGK